MNEKTIDAIHECVAKYRKYSRMRSPGLVAGLRMTQLECALCLIYHTSVGTTSCKGCPVYAVTGLQYCAGTPYVKASELRNDIGARFWSPEYLHQTVGRFRKACKEEADFLGSLLPETNKSKT